MAIVVDGREVRANEPLNAAIDSQRDHELASVSLSPVSSPGFPRRELVRLLAKMFATLPVGRIPLNSDNLQEQSWLMKEGMKLLDLLDEASLRLFSALPAALTSSEQRQVERCLWGGDQFRQAASLLKPLQAEDVKRSDLIVGAKILSAMEDGIIEKREADPAWLLREIRRHRVASLKFSPQLTSTFSANPEDSLSPWEQGKVMDNVLFTAEDFWSGERVVRAFQAEKQPGAEVVPLDEDIVDEQVGEVEEAGDAKRTSETENHAGELDGVPPPPFDEIVPEAVEEGREEHVDYGFVRQEDEEPGDITQEMDVVLDPPEPPESPPAAPEPEVPPEQLSNRELLERFHAPQSEDEVSALDVELAKRLESVADEALVGHPDAAREVVNDYYSRIIDEEAKGGGVRGLVAKVSKSLRIKDWNGVKNGPFIGVRTRLKTFMTMAKNLDRLDGERQTRRQAELCANLIRAMERNNLEGSVS